VSCTNNEILNMDIICEICKKTRSKKKKNARRILFIQADKRHRAVYTTMKFMCARITKI